MLRYEATCMVNQNRVKHKYNKSLWQVCDRYSTILMLFTLISHVMIKLWRNQIAGAVQPWASNTLVTTKSKVIQHEAHPPPDKFRTGSSHCLVCINYMLQCHLFRIISANLGQVDTTAWFIDDRRFILWYFHVLQDVHVLSSLASLCGVVFFVNHLDLFRDESTLSEVIIRSTRTIQTRLRWLLGSRDQFPIPGRDYIIYAITTSKLQCPINQTTPLRLRMAGRIGLYKLN